MPSVPPPPPPDHRPPLVYWLVDPDSGQLEVVLRAGADPAALAAVLRDLPEAVFTRHRTTAPDDLTVLVFRLVPPPDPDPAAPDWPHGPWRPVPPAAVAADEDQDGRRAVRSPTHPVAPTGYGERLAGALADAGSTVRDGAPARRTHGPAQVDGDGFVTVTRSADAGGRLLDWSVTFSPGSPPGLLLAALRHAAPADGETWPDVVGDDPGSWGVDPGLRNWTVFHGDGSVFATDLPAEAAHRAAARLVADGDPLARAVPPLPPPATGHRRTPDPAAATASAAEPAVGANP